MSVLLFGMAPLMYGLAVENAEKRKHQVETGFRILVWNFARTDAFDLASTSKIKGLERD